MAIEEQTLVVNTRAEMATESAPFSPTGPEVVGVEVLVVLLVFAMRVAVVE